MVDCQFEAVKAIPKPNSAIVSRTGSFDGSLCNAHCTNAIAFDTGGSSKIASVTADTLSNMTLTVTPFGSAADTVHYAVCVIDSMKDGSSTLLITDTAKNTTTSNVSYCTIPDKLPPQYKIYWTDT